jgi:hypothetical protein
VREKRTGRDKALAFAACRFPRFSDTRTRASAKAADEWTSWKVSKVPCADFDAKRQFLRDHLEKIISNGGRITIIGCGSNVLGTAARGPIKRHAGAANNAAHIALEFGSLAGDQARSSGFEKPNRATENACCHYHQ